MDSPHLYYAKGQQLGVPVPVLEAARRRRALIAPTGSKPVLSLKHLAVLTGAPHLYLRRIVSRTVDPYTEIVRTKSSGGKRVISAPDPILLGVQRWILANCLEHVSPHGNSYAYEKDKSVAKCASRHIGAQWLVKFDLEDFFGRIDESVVYEVFRKGGYSELVAFEMSRICTRVQGTSFPNLSSYDRYSVADYVAPFRGVLPQGAPTSGKIANIVSSGLDRTLTHCSNQLGLTYTRYSDDIAFSTYGNWSRESCVDLIHSGEAEVEKCGFWINRAKTRVVTPGSRKVVLGILIDQDRIRLLPEVRRRLLHHVRGAAVFGLGKHAEARGFRSVFSFINFMEGHLAYTQAIDMEWTAGVKILWRRALIDSSFPVGNSETLLDS